MCVYACVCLRAYACMRACVCVCLDLNDSTNGILLYRQQLCYFSVYTAKREKEDDEDRKTRMTLKALRYPKKRTMRVSCPYCVRIFPSPQARDGHLQSHAESRPELIKYTCDVCELTFPRFMSMQQHRMTHKGVDKNRCARCALESRDQTLLSKHWKSCQ